MMRQRPQRQALRRRRDLPGARQGVLGALDQRAERHTAGTGRLAPAALHAGLDEAHEAVIDRRAELHQLLAAGASFVLNVLAADQEEVSRRFAADERNRFHGMVVHASGGGLPVLGGVAAHFECAAYGQFPAGDHTVFLGLVTGGAVSELKPLLHYRGGYAAMMDG